MATETTNYKFIKDAPNEFYDVAKVNANLDKIDEAIEGALEKANQAFQSASDGKQVIATAITGKGVPTSSSDTFQKMATNIDAIETDPSIGTTNAVAGDILSGKKAVSQGNLLTGTIPIATDFMTSGDFHPYGTATADPANNNMYLQVPKGYYGGTEWLGYKEDNLIPANLKQGISIGKGKPMVGTYKGEGNVGTGDVLAPGRFSTAVLSNAVGTMPNNGILNQTITSNNGQVNIASGYYAGGVIKAIFPNLIAENIRAGVNIGGVVGSYEGPYRIINVPSKTYSYGTTNTPIDGIGGVVAVHPLAFTINGVSTSYSEEFLDGNYNGVAAVTLQPRSANGVILPGITVTLSANNLKIVISGDRETQKITIQAFKMLVK